MGEPAVLLLHGQPGSAVDWERVQTAIGDRTRIIAFDRPGWNRHGSPRDLAGNAEAASAILDRKGIDRATVVGHSLGGAVAAWLAAESPERVTALVLAAPSANCASLNRLDQLLAAPLMGPVISAAALAGAGAAVREPRLRRRLATSLGLEEGYLRRVGGAFLSPATWRAFAAEQRMLFRELPGLERRLAAISAPTTVVSGTADRIVSPASARQVAGRIPGAELVLVAGGTHLLPQQRPGELAEIIVAAASRAS